MKTKLSKATKKQLLSKVFAILFFQAVYLVAGAVLLLLVELWYHTSAYFRGDTIYKMASMFQDNPYVFIGIYSLIGFVLVPYLVLRGLYVERERMHLTLRKAAEENVESVELEDSLKEFESDLNHLLYQMELNQRAAKEAEQKKNDLIVYLAHDLKTPLTSVIGYLTLLLEGDDLPEDFRNKYLGISLDKAERLEDLINEFFEITRFNLTTLTLEPSHANLVRMLEQVIFEFEPMFQEKGLICKLSGERSVELVCDLDKMQRVFDNLLKNAVNYCYNNSEIHIDVSLRLKEKENGQDYVVLKMMNQGDTIPKEKLDRLFEQFYRLDSSRGTKHGGTGLGLAIAKEIVELHGGSITARSEDESIEFTVTLPIK